MDIKYVAFDGKMFDFKEECERYEETMHTSKILCFDREGNLLDVSNFRCLQDRINESFFVMAITSEFTEEASECMNISEVIQNELYTYDEKSEEWLLLQNKYDALYFELKDMQVKKDIIHKKIRQFRKEIL